VTDANPAKLPSPIEWVNKRKIKAKDAVNTVWRFSKGDHPKADVTKVLTPYSERDENTAEESREVLQAEGSPSGYDIAAAFGKENGGAIPSNLLQIPNTESTSHYLRMCKLLGKDGHPARFPAALPEFFIEFLTDPGDLVIDIFSGSDTTGAVAEQMGRNWFGIELDRSYAALSAVRFMEHGIESDIIEAMKLLDRGECMKISTSVGLAADSASDVRPMEESQGSLFQNVRTGTI
jgi:hypothetical protein